MTILELEWLNFTTLRTENPIIKIIVNDAKLLEDYLEDIFDQTLKMEQLHNSKLVTDPLFSSLYKHDWIQLFRNDLPLDAVEYNKPITILRSNASESGEIIQLMLRTRHCGSVDIAAIAASDNAKEGRHLLKLDFGVHTTRDLKDKLEDKLKHSVEYVFTNDSDLFIHPFNQGRVRMLHFQFQKGPDQVYYKRKLRPTEIGVKVNGRTHQKKDYQSQVIFVDNLITGHELVKFVKTQTNIPVVENFKIRHAYNGHLQLEETLESCGVDDGDEIFFSPDWWVWELIADLK